MSEEALLGELYRDVLTRVDADVARHRNLIWNACITLLADSLRHADFFTRERLLRGLVPELRDSMARLSQLLDGQDGGAK